MGEGSTEIEWRGYGTEACEDGFANGRGIPERTRPTTPKDFMEPLMMSV
jgi:hypothetical protein